MMVIMIISIDTYNPLQGHQATTSHNTADHPTCNHADLLAYKEKEKEK